MQNKNTLILLLSGLIHLVLGLFCLLFNYQFSNFLNEKSLIFLGIVLILIGIVLAYIQKNKSKS